MMQTTLMRLMEAICLNSKKTVYKQATETKGLGTYQRFLKCPDTSTSTTIKA